MYVTIFIVIIKTPTQTVRRESICCIIQHDLLQRASLHTAIRRRSISTESGDRVPDWGFKCIRSIKCPVPVSISNISSFRGNEGVGRTEFVLQSRTHSSRLARKDE